MAFSQTRTLRWTINFRLGWSSWTFLLYAADNLHYNGMDPIYVAVHTYARDYYLHSRMSYMYLYDSNSKNLYASRPRFITVICTYQFMMASLSDQCATYIYPKWAVTSLLIKVNKY